MPLRKIKTDNKIKHTPIDKTVTNPDKTLQTGGIITVGLLRRGEDKIQRQTSSRKQSVDTSAKLTASSVYKTKNSLKKNLLQDQKVKIDS